MKAHFGHDKIDLFKMDVEFHEWAIFESWFKDASKWDALPMQVLVEIHAREPNIVIDLNAEFVRAGYAIVYKENNPQCSFCTEITLLRVAC
jgi:hypothetical protein